MFQDGWVCRACWKPNRSSDARCYVCKTPREQQLAAEPGSTTERTTPGWQKRNRLDANLGLIAGVVSIPIWISGASSIVWGVLLFLLSLISALRVAPNEMNSRLIVMGLAVVIVLLGMLSIFIARSIRRRARWAYAYALLVFGVPAFASFFLVRPMPANVAMPAWFGTAVTIYQWTYLVLALLAGLLLAASFMRSAETPGQGRRTAAS